MSTTRDYHAVDLWLTAFHEAVDSLDFESGRRLFADDVWAYGTRVPVMSGLDSLVENQWHPVWNGTRGFRITDVDYLERFGAACVVAARWQSESLNGRRREGRCTLVLTGEPLRCQHSHFSMTPSDGGQLA